MRKPVVAKKTDLPEWQIVDDTIQRLPSPQPKPLVQANSHPTRKAIGQVSVENACNSTRDQNPGSEQLTVEPQTQGREKRGKPKADGRWKPVLSSRRPTLRKAKSGPGRPRRHRAWTNCYSQGALAFPAQEMRH